MQVLDGVDPVVGEKWEKGLERNDHVLVDVAAVVDHEIEPANLAGDPPEEVGICPATLKDPNPWFLQWRFFVEINGINLRVWEKGFPHAQGAAPLFGIIISTDSNLQQVQRQVAK